MKRFILAIFLPLFLVLYSSFFIPNALADNEFSTSYKVEYDIDPSGEALVTQSVILKNLTDRFFVSSFNLTIGSTTLSDISASDQKGDALQTQVDSKGNKTSITVSLPQPVTGQGKTQSFTLKFKSKDFAQSLGKTWEVNLPRIPNSADIENYDLSLSVPLSFGDPTSISVPAKSESTVYNRQIFNFSKTELGGRGVSINFGSNQVFDFSLSYHFENNSVLPILTSFTLPPDTNYQDISISQINPQPENVTVDSDGNYLAWYKLNHNQNLDVSVLGLAKIYIQPKKGGQARLSDNQKASLTVAQTFWESDNQSIKSALSEIFKDGVPKTNQEKAKAIYSFVVNSLKYDTSKVSSNNLERLGAVTALNNPNSAVCMEFTDLFIALARALGIPARELDGYAYSQNRELRPLSLSKDLLHAWPEYYDKQKGWVMVDPTWEHTSGGVDYFNKFDLNHLVLAIHGSSSTSPNTTNSVSVNLAKADFVSKPNLKVTLGLPGSLWAGLPYQATIRVSNLGTGVQEPVDLTLNSQKNLIQGPKNLLIGPIPPFGNATYELNLRSSTIFDNYSDDLNVGISETRFHQPVLVRSFFAFGQIPYLLAVILGIIVGGYVLVLGVHIYHKKIKVSV